MNIFRKHRRALLVFMFFGIGIPMLFFGVPGIGMGPSPQGDMELARVGNVPIMASELHRNLTLAARRSARGGQEPPTFRELQEQGVAGDVLDEMISSALIEREENKRGFDVDRALLEERLRDDPTFRDDAGNFIPSRYNAWVTSRQGMDWTPIYDEIRDQVSRQVYMSSVLAPANRVLEQEIQQELADRYTKIQIEYLKVEPEVEPTDEEIQAEYGENKDAYRKPESYVADYVAIPLRPGPSGKVQEVLEKARAGEDFAALADEYSDLDTKNGGDLGWLAEREVELDYRKPLFALDAGEVSDPVPGPNGFYIYKVDEVRENEETEQPEYKARHIYLEVELSDEELAAREERANALAEKARELGGGLQAAAEEMGVTLERAEGFTVESTEIAGIPRRDAFQFRRAVDEAARNKAAGEDEDTEYPVIQGADNLYVAEVAEIVEGAVPPLAEVREQVRDDVIARKKNEAAYQARATELADQIKAQASTLDEIGEKFPEIATDIRETRPFTKRDNLFQDQIYIQTPQIYDALEGKEENELAGPLTDILGSTYFIALTNREEPTEEDKANWDEELEQLRQQRIQVAEMRMLQDYLAYLRERELPRVNWTIDWDVFNAVVGTDDDAAEEDTATPASQEPLELEFPEGEPAGDGDGAPATPEGPLELEIPAADPAPEGDPAPAPGEPLELEFPATEPDDADEGGAGESAADAPSPDSAS